MSDQSRADLTHSLSHCIDCPTTYVLHFYISVSDTEFLFSIPSRR